MAFPADTYSEAVDLSITASNQLHTILNGDSTTEVTVEDGSKIPSVRKAYTDSLFFLSPQPWTVGEYETVYNQLRAFVEPTGITTWWFSKTATVSTPILMSTTPHEDSNWTLWNAINNSVYETQKRLAAEAGLNMVGSFLLGATVTTTNDVVFYETDGKYYAWEGSLPKDVAAGSTPATSGGVGAGAWVDKTDLTLRSELISQDGASKVGFKQAGTGAAATTVQSKLREFVSIKDFGAVGDGVTDDTAAIQAAHNASRAVQYPEPSAFYKITDTITLQPGSELISPDRIEGNDAVATIKYMGAAGTKMFACGAANSAKGVVVRGLVLDGNNLAETGLSLHTYRSNISNATIKNLNGVAIDFPDSSVWAGENRVEGCIIYGCDIGIRGGNRSFDGFITDSLIYNCATACVDLAVDGGWFVSGNHFYGQCTHAIKVASTQGGRYVSNLFDAHNDYGIKLTVGVSSCSTLVSGNTFTNLTTGTRYGVHLTMNASAKVLVSENTFFVSTPADYYAVFKAGGSILFGKISENALINMTSAAVSVDANTEYLQLTNSTLIAQVSRVNFLNSVSIINGFGSPSASDGTGSIYAAYNTSDATAKGPLFVRYKGAWQKVPVLARWHTYAAEVPTTGEWTQGDVVWNTAPSAGETPGWVCTKGGAAGTFVFKAMANLAT